MSVRFEFNFCPISVNKLYINIPNQARRFKSTEGKKFTALVEAIITKELKNSDTSKKVSELVGKKLRVEITIESPSWLLKDGKSIRKKDIASAEKILNDSIFSSLSNNGFCLDDSQIWELHMIKCVKDKEKTIVIITESTY